MQYTFVNLLEKQISTSLVGHTMYEYDSSFTFYKVQEYLFYRYNVSSEYYIFSSLYNMFFTYSVQNSGTCKFHLSKMHPYKAEEKLCNLPETTKYKTNTQYTLLHNAEEHENRQETTHSTSAYIAEKISCQSHVAIPCLYSECSQLYETKISNVKNANFVFH